MSHILNKNANLPHYKGNHDKTGSYVNVARTKTLLALITGVGLQRLEAPDETLWRGRSQYKR
jgi:hypothetical protein